MTQSVLTDAVLVDRVLAGFEGAFDELYRRHVESAWRVAQAVTGNGHDAADAVSEAFAKVLQSVKAGRLEDGTAFRSYLLTATRNAGLDILRRSGKLRTGADDHLDLVAATTAGPAERFDGVADATLVAEAFRNLPERWRSVLWLTEVEGVPTKDAAAALGLTANGAAQLAVRARAGLRERFLQAHLRGEVAPDCRFTVDHLGAYVGGGISPRDLAKVDQHLAGCETCRARKEELEDLGSTLRRIVLPLPIALAGATGAKVAGALVMASSSAGSVSLAGLGRLADMAKAPTPFMRRLAGASAAGVLALGILSIPFAKNDTSDAPTFAESRTDGGAEDKGIVNLPTATLAESTTTLPDGAGTPVTATAPPATSGPELALTPTSEPAPAGAGAQAPTASQPPQEQPPADQLAETPDSSEPPAAVVEVGAGANLGDHTAGIAVEVGEEPAVGVAIDDQTIGTAPVTTPEEPGITIVAGPLGTIGLP
jgi:RNA polymerase sigma factor (sigma-70 family)